MKKTALYFALCTASILAAAACKPSTLRPTDELTQGPSANVEYAAKPGDTLIRIGLDTGQSWKDIARWNQIDNPNLIEVGQELRIEKADVGGP
ncbi:MAG TPA: LysM domain-containing protein, partial [Oligoflexia bacterium]|nr:LysM domain-containing protein [Oligoflexia bacterium]